MIININGKSEEIAEGTSLQTWAETKKLPQKILIFGLNGEIVKRENWHNTCLKPGGSLEIIRIIGGG